MVFDQEGDKGSQVSTLDEEASMAQIKAYVEGEDNSQHSSAPNNACFVTCLQGCVDPGHSWD